jgi:holliday junction DNA helicase RuvA
VLVPLSTFYAVGDPGARLTLRVHTRVTEDAIQLFGFHTPLEQGLFERMIAVNGIGPKLALAVLSGIEPGDLVRAVRQADLARLVRIPGIGRKTAERLVLELKDRLPDSGDTAGVPAAVAGDDVREDILSALLNLGYQRSSVEKVLDGVIRRLEVRDVEPLLREVLKELSRP